MVELVRIPARFECLHDVMSEARRLVPARGFFAPRGVVTHRPAPMHIASGMIEYAARTIRFQVPIVQARGGARHHAHASQRATFGFDIVEAGFGLIC
jgi:hypothetical protein